MAFVPRDELPRPDMEGKKYVLNQDVSNMGGTFEKGTIMTCVEVHCRGGYTLRDSQDNHLLLSDENFNECCTPL